MCDCNIFCNPSFNFIFIDFIVSRAHGIDKIYKFDASAFLSKSSQVVFMIPSDLISAKHVIDQINAQIQLESRSAFNLILVPRKLDSIMKLIEEEGVYEYVQVYSLSYGLIRYFTFSRFLTEFSI